MRPQFVGRLPLLAATLVAVLAGCTSAPVAPPDARTPAVVSSEDILLLDRITWGANSASARALSAVGRESYLERQLHPIGALPPEIQARIDRMAISRQPIVALAQELEERRRRILASGDAAQKSAQQQALQRELTGLAREAASRSLLRALYSPDQLLEQMTWFWMNHFSVFQGKAQVRALVADYEDHAIREHALGRFRDLLGAVVRHPAMLRYLDNAQNAAGHLNENYARELLELHTMGVDGGYTQTDVQELARVLTGLGVNYRPEHPRVRPALQPQYVREGLFEFNPNRHDYGDKLLLGRRIRGRGLAEVDEALDLIAREPATARFVSRKLALYLGSDDPPRELIDAMARTFQHTDGDIAATLRTLFASPQFSASLGHKFKDPVHYVVSALRLAYDKPVLNTAPAINWLFRLGEPLYGRLTPDGYPLTELAWASPGQMETRFEIARVMGAGSAGLFRDEEARATERPAFPRLANALYYQSLQQRLGPDTQRTLSEAVSSGEWNFYLLASPEFMYR